MIDPAPTSLSPRRNAARFVVVGLILLFATLLAHVWSLWDGLFLDDHWHQAQLARGDWSIRSFFEDTILDPPRFIDIWWQDRPARWQYARPLAVLVSKITYAVSGGSVFAQHAVGLALHYVTVLLVFSLCWRLTRNLLWSVVGGLLFAVYSHSVFAVGWLAAQNTLLQTCFSVAAVLAYARASRLELAPPWPTRGARVVPSPNVAALAFAVLFWALGLAARENALVLPAIFAALDLSFGGKRWLWARRWIFVVFFSICAAYTIWRLGFFYQPVPDVYFRRPDGADYAPWLLAKFMHYIASSIWLSPMTIGPTGRFNPFTEVPADCLLMAAIIAVMSFGYFFATRRAPGWWIWPLWIVLSILPVLPVMATPHSGYMPGVGFAIAMILGAALGASAPASSIGRWRKPVAIWFLIATCTYIPIYRGLWKGMRAGEQFTPAFLAQDAPPAPGVQLYFIDLPFVNVYVDLAAREAWREPVAGTTPRSHVLTFAPQLVKPEAPCEIQQLDDHRLLIRRPADGAPYYCGLLGRFLVGAFTTSGGFHPDERFENQRFSVRVADMDATGVRALEFTFREPLWSPQSRFYLTLPNQGALRLRFEQGGERQEFRVAWPDPSLTSANPVWRELENQRSSLFNIRAFSQKIIRSDLYLTGPPYPGPR